jgi:protease IV
VNKSRNRAIFGVLFLVLLFFIILIMFANFTMKAFQTEGRRGSQGRDQIAVIEIEGVIMESKKYIELLHDAEKSRNVKAIILRINSPGGAVGPTQEIYQEIQRINASYDRLVDGEEIKFPERAKPVYASFGSIAASGGYYLGAGTREIYANPGTLTGSIGVIMQFMDLSRLYEFAKISPQTIKAGRFKDLGQPNRGLTQEEEDLMGDMLQVVHKQFVDDILQTRKSKIQGDVWELAQGQIFSGQEAYEAGLVDHLGSLWEAGRAIHEQLELKGELSFQYFRERSRMSLWDFLESLDQIATNLGLKGQHRTPRLMYTGS